MALLLRSRRAIGRVLGPALCTVLLPLGGCALDGVDAPVDALAAPRTAAAAVSLGPDFAVTATGAAAVGTPDEGLTPTALDFSTYEGSREVVHPDVAAFPAGWQGHRYWAAITPYPNSASRFENPSLFGSEDGNAWAVPAGVTNPLATTKRGYLSDPDVLFNPAAGQLWLYYREVLQSNANAKNPRHVADQVWLTTSNDGVKWSAPKAVAVEKQKYVVSPTVVRRADGSWRMWQVNAATGGCNARETRLVMRRSTDGVRWTATAPVKFTQPGYTPWHVDVQWVAARQEYWALVAAYVPAQGCTATSLFLATSPDGETWTTYPTPVLARGAVPQFGQSVYRSTFAYEAGDRVNIWYTGARVTTPAAKGRPAVLAWGAAVTHTSAGALLARVAQPATAAARAALQAARNAPAAPLVRTEQMP